MIFDGKNLKYKSLKAFTLVELMMVSVIMVMITGICYSFYVNMVRVYFKGSEALLQIMEAQNVLDLLCYEIRQAARIVTLKPDLLVFQKYYEARDSNEDDPVGDLNSIRVKTVHLRVRKNKEGFYLFERKEDIGNFKPLHSSFRSQELFPEIFTGWRLSLDHRYEVYQSSKWEPNRIPIVEVRLDIRSEKNPLVLFRKVFMPVPAGELPKYEI